MQELSNRLSIAPLGEYYYDLLTLDAWISRNSVGTQAKMLTISELKKREAEIFEQLEYLATKRNISPEQMKQKILKNQAKQLTPESFIPKQTAFTNSRLLKCNATIHRALAKMMESDRPMILVNADGFQISANELAIDLFGDEPGVCIDIKGSDYWTPKDFREFQKKLIQANSGDVFEHTACGIVSSDKWARVKSQYEILEGEYRLATILDCEFIDKPDEAD